jgi:hypothetical protein
MSRPEVCFKDETFAHPSLSKQPLSPPHGCGYFAACAECTFRHGGVLHVGRTFSETPRLSGELRRAGERFFTVNEQLTLDFTHISFIDRDGLAFRHSLQERHVIFTHCSAFMPEQLKG